MNTKIYKLKSGVKLNRQHPTTFEIPSDVDKMRVEAGDFVKLIFDGGEYGTERMWVQVTAPADEWGEPFTGTLANEPFCIPGLDHGDTVTFKAKHIIDILPADA